MIVELNRIYITTAPDASAGIHGPEDFSEAKIGELTYSHLKKLNHTSETQKEIKCFGHVFDLKGKPMQAFIFSDLPEKMIKKRLLDRVAIVKKNTK